MTNPDIARTFNQLATMLEPDGANPFRVRAYRELPGFGETLEQNILKALDVARKSSGRVLLGGAWVVAHQLAEHVRRVPGVEEVELAGSFRRRRDTIGDLDIVASGGAPEAVMSAFTSHPEVVEVL